MPGYSGYVPGLVAENAIGASRSALSLRSFDNSLCRRKRIRDSYTPKTEASLQPQTIHASGYVYAWSVVDPIGKGEPEVIMMIADRDRSGPQR